MDLQEILEHKNLLILIAVVALVLYYRYKHEGFAAGESNRLEGHVSDIPIQPVHVNPDTRTLMAGSGFIPQKEVIPPWGEPKYGANDAMDDGAGGSYGLMYNLCSPACCSDQWPTPFKLPYDKFVCGDKDEYVPSNYTCNNNWQSSGCLCLKKEQANFLYDRGNNA